MVEQADVIVVGMGPGGEDLANRLAQAGRQVIGVEGELVGGECPYWGCIPSKMALRAAAALAEGRRVPELAGRSEVVPDWAPVAHRISEATDGWDDRAAAERFCSAGGRLVRGFGRLEGLGRVRVGDQLLEARLGVVLNVGTVPVLPHLPGLSAVPYWTNREVLATRALPASLLLLGGGAIGVELAQCLARFGTRVTVVEASERLVPSEEPEAGQALAAVFAREGIQLRTGVQAEQVAGGEGEVRLRLSDGSEVQGERLLVAVGRRPRTEGLGLESLGVDPAAHPLPVNELLQLAPGVWAIGDMVGQGAFTHLSMYHAGMVLSQLLGRPHPTAPVRALPRVTFTEPEIGSVGLSEAQARQQLSQVLVGKAEIASSSRGWIHGPGADGLIKLVADGDREVLVGLTVMSPGGGEVLAWGTLAVHAGVPLASLRDMVYAFPTFHRAIEAALGELAPA